MSFTLAKRTLVGSLITATSSFSTLVLAQQQAGFTITPSVGYYNMDDDRDTKDDEAYSLGLGHQFDNPWAIKLVYLNADTSLSSNNSLSNIAVDLDQNHFVKPEPLVEPEPIEEISPTEPTLNEPVFAEGEEPSLAEQAAVVEAQPPLTLKVQFGNNKTTVEQAFYPEIEKLSTYLNEHPNDTVVIEGHTDDSGTASYNQSISEKRAQAIADVLIDIFQISEKRVSAIGYGEERPLFNNDTAQHRKANRRVTAIISSNET
jgi:OOP family OmpA-OmpF porin